MRPTAPLAVLALLLVTGTVLGLSPAEYEQMGQDAARSGNYVVAAQDFGLAAEGYEKIGNYSAAAVNHERAATYYSAIGSSTQYQVEAEKAAASYARAGDQYSDGGDYWSAANAYARSAAFYNLTNKEKEFKAMEIKAGETYLLSSTYAANGTEKVRGLYRAAVSFFSLAPEKFDDAEKRLEESVEVMKREAVEAGDPGIFDVLELYYLPLFQLAFGQAKAGEKMEETGDLAREMLYLGYAGSYYTSAAIFYSEAGEPSNATHALGLAADAYYRDVEQQEVWNYTTYQDMKDYVEESLYILNYLNDSAKADSLAIIVRQRMEPMVASMVSKADTLAQSGEYAAAASNLSAAAEVSYVLGDEVTFKHLNGRAGWTNYLLAREYQAKGQTMKAANAYDQAGFLLRLAGNRTYRQAYAQAAGLYRTLGNGFIASGNLTAAATTTYSAAEDFRLSGDASSSKEEYAKYVSILENLMTSNPGSEGLFLLSIGDAQRAMGENDTAVRTYAQASDQLVQVLSTYLSQSPQYLAQVPGLPKGLVKAYRLSGRFYLARHTVETLDMPPLYGTAAILASYAQMYKTAARIHLSLAHSDLSSYDFQSYAVNQLFRGIASLMAGDLNAARKSLNSFESISHDLHSSNRKFYELLSHSLAWKTQGNETERRVAESLLKEIQQVAGQTDTAFLLEDLKSFLEIGAEPDELLSQASTRAEEKDWKEAGRLSRDAGLLEYFAEDYNRSQSAFEDASFYFIKSGEYEEAKAAATRASECTFEPSEFVLGLQSLSQALQDSNRTLAGIAKSSLKEAAKKGYKADESKELMRMASKLAGVTWTPVIFHMIVVLGAVLTAVAALLIVKRRTRR